MYKMIPLVLGLFFAHMAQGAQFQQTAIEYNKVGGTLAVGGYFPNSPREYVIPLNDAVDTKMKNLSWRQCIVIVGSKNNGVFYARDIRSCQ